MAIPSSPTASPLTLAVSPTSALCLFPYNTHDKRKFLRTGYLQLLIKTLNNTTLPVEQNLNHSECCSRNSIVQLQTTQAALTFTPPYPKPVQLHLTFYRSPNLPFAPFHHLLSPFFKIFFTCLCLIPN